MKFDRSQTIIRNISDLANEFSSNKINNTFKFWLIYNKKRERF